MRTMRRVGRCGLLLFGASLTAVAGSSAAPSGAPAGQLTTSATVGNEATPTANALTDSDIHVPPNYYTMLPPSVGGSYVDPVFGTTVTRLTDSIAIGGTRAVPEYSQSSSYNLDDTYLVLIRESGHHLYDGNGNHIQSLSGVSEPRWSRTNPHWLYFHTSNEIRRWNVATNQIVTIRSFPSGINFGNGTGDVADNDRIVILRGNRYISIWDLVNGTQVSGQELDTFQFPINGSSMDWVTITKDGNSFVVGFNASGSTRGRGAEQYDVNGNFIVQLLNNAPHSAMGRDLDGSPVLFVTNAGTNPQQPAGCNAGIVKVTLDGAATRTCLLPIPWGMEVHLSGHGNDGWVYLSTFRPGAQPVPASPGDNSAIDDTDWHVYNGEILRVRADGSLVERLAHHRSRGDSYWIQPHANISISGNKLVYGSDFQLNAGFGYADTYALTIDPPPPSGYYVLDRFGGVYAGGDAPVIFPPTPYWGFEFAQDLELTPTGTGYYVLDRFGGMHSGGGAPILSPTTPYWGFNVASDLEIAPIGYYVLDRFGGVHAGGGAPILSPATPYWGFDVASDLELAPVGFYVLDRFGGVHSGGGAPILSPTAPYWGFDVANDLELAFPDHYYVLDRFGGVHAGGGAPVLSPITPYWGFDVAGDLELASPGYYVLDRFGGVHAGGGAPVLSPTTTYWGFDLGQDLELRR